MWSTQNHQPDGDDPDVCGAPPPVLRDVSLL
jgi:hypothetical protein